MYTLISMSTECEHMGSFALCHSKGKTPFKQAHNILNKKKKKAFFKDVALRNAG